MKKVSTGAAREKRNFQEQKLTQDQDWESPIQKFEEQDKVNPPKSGGHGFYGFLEYRSLGHAGG